VFIYSYCQSQSAFGLLCMSVFDNERITNDIDWKENIHAQVQSQKHEIEALRIIIKHQEEVIKNIKIDVERAIKKCLSTLNIAKDLP
jgi:hypothetical protein